MGGKELAEKWQGALPAARRRFEKNVRGEEAMTEERPAYTAEITVADLLDTASEEREGLIEAYNRATLQRGHLEQRLEELRISYDVAGLRGELLSVAGELAERRLEVVGLVQALKSQQERLKEDEISLRISWRQGPQAQEPDPTTGKVNQAWVTLREDLAMYGAAHLREGRLNVSEAETALRVAQAELDGAMDRLAALRHVARLTSAELAYLAGGGA